MRICIFPFSVPFPLLSVPFISAVSQSPTSITLTWTQPEGEVVDSYEVSFSYQGPCSGFNHTNTTTVDGTTRQYTLTGLQEFSNYTVTLVAVNDAGGSEESGENIVTMAGGTYVCLVQKIAPCRTLSIHVQCERPKKVKQ